MSLITQFENFYQVAVDNAQLKPRKTIIFEDDLKISNQQFLAYVDSVASYLQQAGIRKGDKVALLMANSWQFIVNFFAINKIGGVIVTVNNFLKEDEIAYILNDSQAKILFVTAKLEKEARNLIYKTGVQQIIWVDGVPLENEHHINYNNLLSNIAQKEVTIKNKLNELALIVYTSGTTGKPKGAMLSHKNLFSNIRSCMQQLRMQDGKIPMICYLPMFHAFTLTVTVLLPIVTNSGVVVIPSIATKGDFAKLLKQVLFKRVPFLCGVPDVFSALSRAQLPWYGITECSPVVSVNQPWANRTGSVGKALPGYEVATFDDAMNRLQAGEIGEICVKGDCVMMGYYNRPNDTAEAIINGWFKTGDIGKVDHDGFIFIVDRKKDLIISKGMNIYPREIEEIIYTHEKVNACAVVGLKDAEANETPVAYIELKEDVTASESEMKDYIRPHLAPYKQPRKIYFVEKLPRNATGKILKRELREELNKIL